MATLSDPLAANTVDYKLAQEVRLGPVRHTLGTGELVAGLAAAQLKFASVVKKTVNPYFNSKYADLAEVISATQEALASEGIVVVQFPIVREKEAGVDSWLMHKSGQWMAREFLLPALMKGKDGTVRFDAQSVGSAITYARRYAYQAHIGVAGEVDDDANHASGNNGSKEAAKEMIEKRKEYYQSKEPGSAKAEVEGKGATSTGAVALKKVHFDTRGEWTYLTGEGLGTLLHFLGLPAEEGGIYQFKEKFMAADKDEQGFPIDWRVKSNKAELLAEAAVSYGLDAKQVSLTDQLTKSIAKSSGTALVERAIGPSTTGAPETARAPRRSEGGATSTDVRPQQPKRAILAEGHLAGTLDGAELTKLKQKQGQYLKVRVGEYEASLFDNFELDLDGRKVRAFVELPNSLHQPVEFLVKPNGQYLNVVRILRLACFEWDNEGIPIRRYDAPSNPDITDADLGI